MSDQPHSDQTPTKPRNWLSLSWLQLVLGLVLVAYPLSFGPACWIGARTNSRMHWGKVIYSPLFLTWAYLPESIQMNIESYANLGAGSERYVSISESGIFLWEFFDFGPGVTFD